MAKKPKPGPCSKQNGHSDSQEQRKHAMVGEPAMAGPMAAASDNADSAASVPKGCAHSATASSTSPGAGLDDVPSESEPSCLDEEAETSRDREQRLMMGFCSASKCSLEEAGFSAEVQQLQEHTAQGADSPGDHSASTALVARLQAQVGQLVGEVAGLEEERDDMAAQIRSLKADLSYHAAAKQPLEERVTALAAALVQAEGRAEALQRELQAATGRKNAGVNRALGKALSMFRGPATSPDPTGNAAGDEEEEEEHALSACWPGTASRKAGKTNGSREASAAASVRQEATLPTEPALPEGPCSSRCSVELPPTPAREDKPALALQRQQQTGGRAALEGATEPPLKLLRTAERACDADLGRADSAEDMPAKRRAVGEAPSRQRRTQDLDSARGAEGPKGGAAPEVAALMAAVALEDTSAEGQRSPVLLWQASAGLLQRGPAARLKFAHAVTPLISHIGRELATSFAAVLEPVQLKAAAEVEHHDTDESSAAGQC